MPLLPWNKAGKYISHTSSWCFSKENFPLTRSCIRFGRGNEVLAIIHRWIMADRCSNRSLRTTACLCSCPYWSFRLLAWPTIHWLMSTNRHKPTKRGRSHGEATVHPGTDVFMGAATAIQVAVSRPLHELPLDQPTLVASHTLFSFIPARLVLRGLWPVAVFLISILLYNLLQLLPDYVNSNS